jgi:hypothetical protein
MTITRHSRAITSTVVVIAEMMRQGLTSYDDLRF